MVYEKMYDSNDIPDALPSESQTLPPEPEAAPAAPAADPNTTIAGHADMHASFS